MNCRVSATGGPNRCGPSTTGSEAVSIERILARLSGSRQVPRMSSMTGDRSRISPLAPNTPGFSEPGCPYRKSFTLRVPPSPNCDVVWLRHTSSSHNSSEIHEIKHRRKRGNTVSRGETTQNSRADCPEDLRRYRLDQFATNELMILRLLTRARAPRVAPTRSPAAGFRYLAEYCSTSAESTALVRRPHVGAINVKMHAGCR